MSDGSGFPGFHSHSYDRSYSRPLFQVASFSDSGDEQENHVSSPQMRSHSTSRTMPAKPVAPSCLSPSVSRLFSSCSLWRFLVLDDFSSLSEMELMKEKYTKLLLGEDMSGSGKGVCTAVAISNSVTNLYGIYPWKFIMRSSFKLALI